MKHCYAVKGDGKGGGLALYWGEGMKVELLSYGMHHIDVHIREGEDAPIWRATFVYGEAKVQNRRNMWTLLRRIKDKSENPWLMIGDFNEAMWQGEHFSLVKRPERQMQEFREVLPLCNLHDLGFVGLPWTYYDKREGGRNAKVRLDWAVASPEWMDMFVEARMRHLVSSPSDHCSLLLQIKARHLRCAKRKIKRYEIYWERE